MADHFCFVLYHSPKVMFSLNLPKKQNMQKSKTFFVTLLCAIKNKKGCERLPRVTTAIMEFVCEFQFESISHSLEYESISFAFLSLITMELKSKPFPFWCLLSCYMLYTYTVMMITFLLFKKVHTFTLHFFTHMLLETSLESICCSIPLT